MLDDDYGAVGGMRIEQEPKGDYKGRPIGP
jgi:hypothetical protein